MIIALIVVVMLWYSLRNKNKSKEWLKVLNEREKIEIRYISTVNDRIQSTTEIFYSDFIEELSLIQTYQKLLKDYDEGLITSSEFHKLLTILTDKIDIRNILEV